MDLTLAAQEFLLVSKATKNLSENTLTAYGLDLKGFAAYAVTTNEDQISLLKYVEYLAEEKHLKDSSIKRKLIVIKMFSAFLVERGYLSRNLYEQHQFRFKQEKRLPKTMTPNEIHDLLAGLKRRYETADTRYAKWNAARDLALIDTLISTGIRISEASNLSLGDIVTSERTLLIHGKGRKQRLLYISSQQAWEHLRQWLRIRKSYRICQSIWKTTRNSWNRIYFPICNTTDRYQTTCHPTLSAPYFCDAAIDQRCRPTFRSGDSWPFKCGGYRNLYRGFRYAKKTGFEPI